jgi:transposase
VIDDITAVLVLPGFRVLDTQLVSGELTLLVETPRDLVACPACGAVANVKDRRTVTVRDLPTGGTPVIVRWHQENLPVPTYVVREQAPGPSDTTRSRLGRC